MHRKDARHLYGKSINGLYDVLLRLSIEFFLLLLLIFVHGFNKAWTEMYQLF